MTETRIPIELRVSTVARLQHYQRRWDMDDIDEVVSSLINRQEYDI